MGSKPIQQHSYREHRTPAEKSSRGSENARGSAPVVPAQKNSRQSKAKPQQGGKTLIKGTAQGRTNGPERNCRPHQRQRNSVSGEPPHPEKQKDSARKARQQAQDVRPSRVHIVTGQNRIGDRRDTGYQKHQPPLALILSNC